MLCCLCSADMASRIVDLVCGSDELRITVPLAATNPLFRTVHCNWCDMLPAKDHALAVACPRLRKLDRLIAVITERLPVLRHPRVGWVLWRCKLVVVVGQVQHYFALDSASANFLRNTMTVSATASGQSQPFSSHETPHNSPALRSRSS